MDRFWFAEEPPSHTATFRVHVLESPKLFEDDHSEHISAQFVAST